MPTGRDTYDYIEGDHMAPVYAARMARGPQRTLSKSSIKGWKAPSAEEPLTEEKRQQIIENICRYFEAYKITYRLE